MHFYFHSVTKERMEIVLQGTRNKTLRGRGIVWEEYEFKCKPGNVKRRPCLISPYHYRLDWLMWFAAFQVKVKVKVKCFYLYWITLSAI